MKRLFAGLFSICLIVLFSSCSKTQKTVEPQNLKTEPVKQAFPLAGTWQTEDKSWELVIDFDGKISTADTSFSSSVKPNSINKTEGWRGESGIIQTGDFELSFEPLSRQVTITIEIKRFYADMGGGILDGSIEFYLTGELSNDGNILFLNTLTNLNLGVFGRDPNSPPDNPVLNKIGVLDQDPNQPDIAMYVFHKIKS